MRLAAASVWARRVLVAAALACLIGCASGVTAPSPFFSAMDIKHLSGPLPRLPAQASWARAIDPSLERYAAVEVAPGAPGSRAVAVSPRSTQSSDRAQGLSDSRIRRLMIEGSLRSYPGNCPCPYNVDRAGRSCGRRSAYIRPGGYAPLCYPSDISAAEVDAYRARVRD